MKLKVVQDYERGIGSYQFIAERYVRSLYHIRNWVKSDQAFGSAGLQRKHENTSYSTQFKLNAVNLYLTSGRFYREIANQLGMNNRALLNHWVLAYREKGENAFSKSRGRPRKEPELSHHTSIKKQPDLSETEQELVKLQNEVLRLRIENEYLKGLRRLRLEQQVRENPSLFTPSNKNSSSRSKKS